MSNFVAQESHVVEQAIDETSTTQKHPLGKIIRAKDKDTTAYGEAEFIYCKGVASTVVGSWVTISEGDYSTALTVADAIGRVATAMSICVASEFGWYQISGRAVGKALASYADDALVYLTATAGSVDDAVVAGDRVKQAISCSALDTPSTGLAEFEMDRPFIDNATAA